MTAEQVQIRRAWVDRGNYWESRRDTVEDMTRVM